MIGYFVAKYYRRYRSGQKVFDFCTNKAKNLTYYVE